MPETFFDQIVFSGGGTRCVWQGGFIDVLRDEIPLFPRRINGVSGGAASGCGFVCHRGRQVLDVMMEKFAEHDRNLPLHEPFDDNPGMSPHQMIYREVIEECFGDEEAHRLICEGPDLRIMIARPPDAGWAKVFGTAMTLVYQADTIIRSNPHLTWPEAAGLQGELVDACRAAREKTLTDLVCAAATIPPAFDPPMWEGRPAIDAGMIDQAPMPDPDEGTTLVLLTKRFTDIPEIPGRTYVMPSEEVSADKIDFTDPEKLRETWRQGEEDARRFLADIATIKRDRKGG